MGEWTVTDGDRGDTVLRDASVRNAVEVLQNKGVVADIGTIVDEVAETDTNYRSVEDVFERYGYPKYSFSIGDLGSDADGFDDGVRLEHHKGQQKGFRNHIRKSDFVHTQYDEPTIDVLVVLIPVGKHNCTFKKSLRDLGEPLLNYPNQLTVPVYLIEYVPHDDDPTNTDSDTAVDEKFRQTSRNLPDTDVSRSDVYGHN
jgi:hypothetical protein